MSSCVVSALFSDFPSVASNHWHDCHQLIYIAKGEAKITAGEKEYTVKEGTVAVFNRFEEHSLFTEKGSCERYIIRISPEEMYSLSKNEAVFSVINNRSEGFENCVSVGEDREEIEYIFKRIFNEYKNPRFMSEDIINLYVKELLIMLTRFMPPSFYEDDTHISGMVSKIGHFLETEYASEHTLESIAGRFSVSPSYMSHKFKEYTGVSVIKYLNNCRMNEAKRLLVTTSKAIKDIVFACGFSDETNFCRNFKRANGLTPLEFRRGMKA